MDYQGLCCAVETVKKRFELLKENVPELKAYLVFSRFGPRSGQCALTTSGETILKEFPLMVMDDPAKRAGLDQLARGEKGVVDSETLSFYGDVLVELRFSELRYELIREIQRDPLIDSDRSDVGSIRAVLGSLEELLQKGKQGSSDEAV